MRTLAVLVLVAVIPLPVRADPLSASDREALIESLEKIRSTVTERVDARFREAIAAYRAAMLDEEEALAFYLKCVEKANFTDVGRRASDFRDWKKREEERTKETAMRRALMHQLRWLILTLRASSENADMDAVSREAMDAIDDVFRDKLALATQRQILGQSVLGTVFAQVYGIDAVKTENWPDSPLDVAGFFENVVFPRYRVTGDVKNLRTAWQHRIRLESEKRDPAPTAKPKGNGRGAGTPPEPTVGQERFATEVLPQLQWEMEVDLFTCGDQRDAARRMVEHLNKYITHDKAKEWSDQLLILLGAKTKPAADSGVSPAAP
jgi:hypothetical protein